ncbi:MAG: hypothetical protein ACRDTE_24695 [Pseudonocardiaceae bacterium]
MRRRVTFAALLVAVLAGCTSRIPGEPVVGTRSLDAHRALVSRYFDAVNAAAGQGSAAQERLFAHTQHPDFRDLQCPLQGLTVTADPAYSTLHTDADWRPPLAEAAPRGTVYVIAATVAVQRRTEVLGSQIGTLHVVVLDGMAYGFAPCPA